MSKELKPCPFCGGEVVIYQNYNEYGVWSVSCDACHVEMVSGVRSILVSAWNTRPAVDAKPADRKQITEILHDISADNARMSRVYRVVREKDRKLTAAVERLKAENGKLKKAIGLINSVACGSFANGCVEDEIFNICKDTLGESELTKQTYKVIYDCVMKKLEGQGKVPDFLGKDTNVPANAPDTNVGTIAESEVEDE